MKRAIESERSFVFVVCTPLSDGWRRFIGLEVVATTVANDSLGYLNGRAAHQSILYFSL
jgi:hypothetical protein